MNKKVALLTGALAATMMTACAQGTTDFSSADPAGQQTATLFAENGYTIEDFKADEDTTSFAVVDNNGGANALVTTYADPQAALDAYDAQKAAMTQSEYYMLSEDEDDTGAVSVFNNSINYVDGILVLDKEAGAVIEVREIPQDQTDDYLDLLDLGL